MAQKYKFGNGVWANKEGSTLAYNDENDNYKPLPFNFTRASIATRVNKAGLIEVVANDQPRIDYTDSADGVLLLENSATNGFPFSQFFGSGALTQYTTGTNTLSFTNNYSIAPDGSQTALRMQATIGSTDARTVLRDLVNNSGSLSTLSVYVKSNTNENVTMAFHFDGGVRAPFIVTPKWQRFTYSEVPNTACNTGIELSQQIGTSNACDVSVWGFQFEAGGTATSIIPTSNGVGSRSADSCLDSGNSEVFNDSEGVFFADISALANDGTARRISISDGSSSNNIFLSYRATANQVRANISGSYDKTITISNTLLYNKLLIKYKSGDISFWINGFELDTSTSNISINGLNTLNFDGGLGFQDLYGKTKEIGYYDTALTDEELETLTSYRNWLSMVNELNLNIIYNG